MMEIVGLNTTRFSLASAGIQTAALAFAGNNPAPAYLEATEEYNGTAWTSNPTGLNTARDSLGGAGTQSAGIAFGGNTTPGQTGATEEWTGAGAAVTKTITVS
jgi:hypothetical protein